MSLQNQYAAIDMDCGAWARDRKFALAGAVELFERRCIYEDPQVMGINELSYFLVQRARKIKDVWQKTPGPNTFEKRLNELTDKRFFRPTYLSHVGSPQEKRVAKNPWTQDIGLQSCYVLDPDAYPSKAVVIREALARSEADTLRFKRYGFDQERLSFG